jgi:hypothetical protein
VKIKRLFFSIIRLFHRSNDEKEKLLVIHVMKTGGTSFRGMLEDYYGPKMVFPGSFFLSDFPFGWYPKGDEIVKAYSTLPTHKVLIGHFAAEIAGSLPFKYRTVTFLRNPIERSLSMLAHYSKAFNISPEDLINDDCFISEHITNYQTKIFGSRHLSDAKDNTYTDNVFLSTAQRRIRNFDFVGITERFRESCWLFDKTFSTRLSFLMRKSNVLRPQGTELVSLAHRIQPFIRLDCALYKYALDLFNEKIKVR